MYRENKSGSYISSVLWKHHVNLSLQSSQSVSSNRYVSVLVNMIIIISTAEDRSLSPIQTSKFSMTSQFHVATFNICSSVTAL